MNDNIINKENENAEIQEINVEQNTNSINTIINRVPVDEDVDGNFYF